MTLSNVDDCSHSSSVLNKSVNWDPLYSSQIWSDSNIRKAVINAPVAENKGIKYCYTCRGKIRNYQIKSPKSTFVPSNHSTPKLSSFLTNEESNLQRMNENPLGDYKYQDSFYNFEARRANTEPNGSSQCIPTISQQVEVNFPKYRSTEYETRPHRESQRRLSKSLKGLKCIVNFTLTDSPKKKRTQIQACSISLMIVAIVVISLVLVNFTTTNFINVSNVTSTILVPTTVVYNESTSSIVDSDTYRAITDKMDFTTNIYSLNKSPLLSSSNSYSSVSSMMTKIRKNIRTYPKDTLKITQTSTPKDQDQYLEFCSCQINEICMLEEQSGKAICKTPIDVEDPTGCGGLCALETEACHLINKTLGVYVCQLLPSAVCSSADFRCRNGLCVSISSRCDGIIQCYDRSDEIQCECDLTKEFRCGGAISCFPKYKMCDGVIDCWDGYDEVNCTTECPKDEFTCTDGQCIPTARFCDGLADCGDKSDEPLGCEACGKHEMRCKNHRCVPLSSRCNGLNDCGDHSDEINCS